MEDILKEMDKEMSTLSKEEVLSLLSMFDGKEITQEQWKQKVDGTHTLWDQYDKARVEIEKFLPSFFWFYHEELEKGYKLPLHVVDSTAWNTWEERDIAEYGFVSALESDYGVHDVCCFTHTTGVHFGYQSYEVEEERIPELLEVWKAKLLELGWTHSDATWHEVKGNFYEVFAKWGS